MIDYLHYNLKFVITIFMLTLTVIFQMAIFAIMLFAFLMMCNMVWWVINETTNKIKRKTNK
jgi:hypothetical protein